MDKESIMGECLIIRSGGGTDTSDATATSDVVLSGYTCYVNDELVTGSMVAQNPGNQSLTPGGEYTIKEGYYDGTDEISVTSLSDNTSANATAGYILTGYNAWVNGSNVSGLMANQGNVSQSLAANGSYTIPAGWHAGAGVVNQSLATQGAVNVTPGTANKTACAANRWTTGSIIILGSSSLVASNIRNGVNIFGVTGNFVGFTDAIYVFGPNGSFESTNAPADYVTRVICYVASKHTVANWIDSGYTQLAIWGTFSARTRVASSSCTASVWIQIEQYSPTGKPQWGFVIVSNKFTLGDSTTSWQSMNVRKLFTSATDATLRRRFNVEILTASDSDYMRIGVKVENFNVAFVRP